MQKKFVCKTQYIDKEFGRPDLYILVDEKIEIIIECKVDSTQSLKQLEKILRTTKKSEIQKKDILSFF